MKCNGRYDILYIVNKTEEVRGIIMNKISRMELLELLSSYHAITPAQLNFVLEEFDYGRGDNIIRNIIENKFMLDKINGKIK